MQIDNIRRNSIFVAMLQMKSIRNLNFVSSNPTPRDKTPSTRVRVETMSIALERNLLWPGYSGLPKEHWR
jgi:hypothetical protein